jgi:phage FluMu protein Com
MSSAELRCTKCNAKLRFDEPPAAGEEVECPKCETVFRAPPPAPTIKKPAEGAKAEGKKPKGLVTKERVHFSATLLLLIVGSLVGLLITGLMTWWYFLYKAGKAEDMLATVPENFNVIRGVNLKAMENYPKVSTESNKYYDAQCQGIYADACKAIGQEPANSMAYFVIAKDANGPNSQTVALFLTKKRFNRAALGDGSVKQMPGSNVRGKVVCPNENLIAVAWNGNEDANLNAVANNANKRPKEGQHTKVGTVGLMAIRGHIWSIIRPTGKLVGSFQKDSQEIKDDGALSSLREAFSSSTVLVTWTSFGSSGVRFGAGLSLKDSASAKSLVKDMWNGPMGQGDDSEPPNGIKRTFQALSGQKEFLQYLQYKSSGESAYLISKMNDPEKASNWLSVFNNVERGSGGR